MSSMEELMAEGVGVGVGVEGEEGNTSQSIQEYGCKLAR